MRSVKDSLERRAAWSSTTDLACFWAMQHALDGGIFLRASGIEVDDRQFQGLGIDDYLPRKRIAPFHFHCDPLPNPAELICTSMVSVAGTSFPEFDRFAVVPWGDALESVGRNLARVLLAVQPAISSSAAR
jgi:hypothetical protein